MTFFVSFLYVISFITMTLNTFYILVIPKFISYNHVLQYLLDTSIWISCRHFKLNIPKREFIFMSLISVNGTTIHLVALIGDTGVIIESSLSLPIPHLSQNPTVSILNLVPLIFTAPTLIPAILIAQLDDCKILLNVSQWRH